MGVLVTATFGLIVWIVLWAQGIKAFDGILVTIMLVMLAVVARAALGLLPSSRPSRDE